MKIKHLLAATLALALCASCSNELPAGQADESLFGEIPEGMFEYRIKLSGITPTRLSYAEGGDVNMEANEMQILTAKVLVFGQETAGDLADTDKLVYLKSGKVVNGEVQYLIPATTPFGTATKACVMMITNEENTNIDDLNLKVGTTPSTYADVKLLLNKGGAGADRDTKGLVQIGKSLDLAIPTPGTNLAITNMHLRRPFARFDIKNEGMKALEIQSMKVKNISDKYYLLTATFPADVNHFDSKDVPVLEGLNRPEGVLKPEPKLIPSVLYSYPGSAAGEDSPILIINGLLSTKDGIKELKDYEVPFAKNGTDKLHITENKRYTLTIKVKTEDIIVDIAEGFEEWGSDGDAEGNYDVDLDEKLSVIKVGEGLAMKQVKADGSFVYDGTASQFTYNLSTSNEPEGAEVKAYFSDATSVVLAKVESYGGITHYVLDIPAAIQKKAESAPEMITIKCEVAGEVKCQMEIMQPVGPSGNPEDPKEEAPLYPVSEGNTLPAFKAAGLWWAPVNVGALKELEPGLIFQYGRNYGWPDNMTGYSSSLDEFLVINDLGVCENEIPMKYYKGNRERVEETYWFEKSSLANFEKFIAPRWEAVSDGNNNPCPVGWRIPTNREFEALIAPSYADLIVEPRTDEAPPLLIIPANADHERLVFPLNGSLNAISKISPGSVTLDDCRFWTVYSKEPGKYYIFNNYSKPISVSDKIDVADGFIIRCVHDVK